VSNLLESAGFSRSNPYYVVQQGKVRMMPLQDRMSPGTRTFRTAPAYRSGNHHHKDCKFLNVEGDCLFPVGLHCFQRLCPAFLLTSSLGLSLLSVAGPFKFCNALQITSLTTMKDTERLALLKEIGGTNVYEERRKESLKIMEDSSRWLSLVFCLHPSSVAVLT
jgi:hypothetical protein